MFITFEGPEGSGKSTCLQAIAGRLIEAGFSMVLTREPGAGVFGGKIRELLLGGTEMPPESELFLFLADRSAHVRETLKPALAEGRVVLCDRYADSTVVYQCHARGLDEAFVREANRFATDGLTPDLTLLLDLPPEVGLARLSSPDRLDREPLEFHQRVRVGFLSEAAREPGRWRVLDATQPAARVAEQAWAEVSARLG